MDLRVIRCTVCREEAGGKKGVRMRGRTDSGRMRCLPLCHACKTILAGNINRWLKGSRRCRAPLVW